MTRRVLICATRPRSGRDSCRAGHTPNTSGGHHSQGRAEKQHRQIHLDDRFGRKRVRRHPRNDEGKAFPGDQHAEDRTGDSDRQRFRQQLLHDPEPCSSERRADRELLLPVRAAYKEQDRHVGAADEQQRRDGAQQQKELGPHRSRIQLDDAAEVDLKRVRVASLLVLCEFLQNRLQLGVGFRRRHARADLQGRAEGNVGIGHDLERDVDVGFAPAKPRGHHADDLIVLANELDRTADHCRVSRVIALPELVAEHHDPRRILTQRRIGRNQPSSHEGWTPQ